MRQPTALGITCGIGSMLIGARQAGFEVIGNVEWRKYYRSSDSHGRNTFKMNFPGAVFKEKLDDLEPAEIERLMNPDLVMGHPECGNFSSLNKDRDRRMTDAGDIPLFVDLVARIRPRFFVMDDLPKSFVAFPMEEYQRRLPDYDLFPEWVSNWGYGNVQKGRDRMFMIGSLKSEGWAFQPGEAENTLLVRDVIGDLPEPRAGSNYPNHDPFDADANCSRGVNVGKRGRNSWGQVCNWFKDKRSGGKLLYVKEDGTEGVRIGFYKGHWLGTSHVLTGKMPIIHAVRNTPYTIRERARIQGFPDDFVFYGSRLDEAGRFNYDQNEDLIKQTGKAMPVQFCHYVSAQIVAHLASTTRRETWLPETKSI